MCSVMKVAIDMFPRRKMRTGTAVYAEELYHALKRLSLPDDEIIPLWGPPTCKKVGFLAALFNLIVDVFWYQIWVPFVLAWKRADVVHFTANAGSLFTTCPQVLTVHDAIFVQHVSSYKWYFRLYARLMWFPSIRRASKIVTVSEASARRIKAVFARPVQVVYNGPGQIRLLLNSADGIKRNYVTGDSNYILYVGMIAKHKNLETLVDGFELVLAKNNELRLVIAGGTGRSKDPWASQLQEEIHARNLQDNVIITGALDFQELSMMYRYAQAVVLPSLEEGFGFTPLEAAAFKKPIVVSDIPVFREVLGESALYAEALSAESWAKAILLAVQMANNRSNWNGLESKYSWDLTARLMMKLYREISGVGTLSEGR